MFFTRGYFKGFCLKSFLSALLVFQFLQPIQARAMDQDVRAVLVAGTYGLGAGTLLGIASYPFTNKVRGIFVGSSIGLYLGLIMGAYYISNRYDPGNPLRPIDGRPLEDPYYHNPEDSSYKGSTPYELVAFSETLAKPSLQISVYSLSF